MAVKKSVPNSFTGKTTDGQAYTLDSTKDTEFKLFLDNVIDAVTNNVRETEKEKLYLTMDDKDKRILALQNQLTDSDNKLRESLSLIQTSVNAQNLLSSNTLNAVTKEDLDIALSNLMTKFSEALPEAMKPYLNPIIDFTTNIKAESTKSAYENAISAYTVNDANGQPQVQLISELVLKDGTREAILQSAKDAHEIWKKYNPQAAAPPQQQQNVQQPASPNFQVQQPQPIVLTPAPQAIRTVPIAPQIPMINSGDNPIGNVKDMSPAEFAANRDSIMAKVKAMIQQ
jgi:hypothetical protein